MKTVKLITLILIFLNQISFAQTELGVTIGTSCYRGDIHCTNDENIGLISGMAPSLGVTYRHFFKEKFALRGNAQYNGLVADDTKFANIGHQKRAFKLNTSMLELTAMLEFHPWKNKRFGKDGFFNRLSLPYFLGGIGVAFLRHDSDFGTPDSQREQLIKEDLAAAKTTQMTLPLGGGVRFHVNENFILSGEMGARTPITDYYDEVSKSGGPTGNDNFTVFCLGLNWNIGMSKE